MRLLPVSRLLFFLALLVCSGALPVSGPFRAAAQTLDKADALAQVNRARILNGLSPLALNAALEKAAQRHSQDMADKGFLDHIGSDGSKLDDRVLAAGYSAWIGRRVWAELVYAGNGSFAEALEFWASDEAERGILFDGRFREIGIGVALNTSPAGVTTAYWTLVLGAQPNALPVFINDGAAVTNMPQVAVRLSQETVMPDGEGNAIGRAIEVRISADPGFAGAAWQKWEALLPFTFDNTPGLKTIYAQYRDTSGRMTVSTASIQFDPDSAPMVIAVGPGAQPGNDEAPQAAPPPDVPPDSAALPVEPNAPPATPPASEPPADAIAAGQSVVATALPVSGPQTPPTPSTDAPAPAVSTLPAAPSRPDAVLPDWLLPAVATAQLTVIALGLLALLRRRQI